MRHILTIEAEPGMILGSDIYDTFGRVLLGKNTVLTGEFIGRLTSLGFDVIYIDDEISKGIELEPLISPALRGEGIACVRNQDIDACVDVGKRIVEQILENGHISLDMNDLRATDDVTYSHSVNVALYSCVIGIGLGLDETQLENLVIAGLLHDLGKMSIPDEILNKKGRLTQEEYQIMKTHAQLSYDLIKDRWDLPTHVKVAVLFHHENVDGSGYPRGIKGDEQTLYTKIIHVSDVYDALVSKRPYKKACSAYEASEYLMGACGRQFEQEIVEALLKYVPLYPKGMTMRLSDGRKCIIYENAGIHNLRPIVRLMNGDLMDLTDRKNLKYTLESEEDDNEFSAESETERSKMIADFKVYKVLSVDDELVNRQRIETVLEHIYDVSSVKSGRQALAYLDKNDWPDIILLDFDMPDMDGIETAGQIKEITGDSIPIVFITSSGDKETVMRCRDAGAAGYIIRPFEPEAVKSELKRVVTDWYSE